MKYAKSMSHYLKKHRYWSAILTFILFDLCDFKDMTDDDLCKQLLIDNIRQIINNIGLA